MPRRRPGSRCGPPARPRSRAPARSANGRAGTGSPRCRVRAGGGDTWRWKSRQAICRTNASAPGPPARRARRTSSTGERVPKCRWGRAGRWRRPPGRRGLVVGGQPVPRHDGTACGPPAHRRTASPGDSDPAHGNGRAAARSDAGGDTRRRGRGASGPSGYCQGRKYGVKTLKCAQFVGTLARRHGGHARCRARGSAPCRQRSAAAGGRWVMEALTSWTMWNSSASHSPRPSIAWRAGSPAQMTRPPRRRGGRLQVGQAIGEEAATVAGIGADDVVLDDEQRDGPFRAAARSPAVGGRAGADRA